MTGKSQMKSYISAEKKSSSKAAATADNPTVKPDPTWVHEIFQGTLTNETRCLNCETVQCVLWSYLAMM